MARSVFVISIIRDGRFRVGRGMAFFESGNGRVGAVGLLGHRLRVGWQPGAGAKCSVRFAKIASSRREGACGAPLRLHLGAS